MADCSQFLESYSDYRDGLLETPRWKELDAHRKACPSCARYDRTVGGGVELLRELPEIVPSDDFAARLQHRIFHLEDDRLSSRHASGVSVAVTLTISAAIGLSAWLPTVRAERGPVRLPPVVAHAPYHEPIVPLLFQTGPLLSPASQSAGARAGSATLLLSPAPLSLADGSSGVRLYLTGH